VSLLLLSSARLDKKVLLQRWSQSVKRVKNGTRVALAWVSACMHACLASKPALLPTGSLPLRTTAYLPGWRLSVRSVDDSLDSKYSMVLQSLVLQLRQLQTTRYSRDVRLGDTKDRERESSCRPLASFCLPLKKKAPL
jgi:hypothetical protein